MLCQIRLHFGLSIIDKIWFLNLAGVLFSINTEFYDTEERCLDSYLKDPLKKDLKYFFKILNNIIIKGAHSK